MLVLDTNHLSAFEAGNAEGLRLHERLLANRMEMATTVVCVEERIGGWLTEIKRRAKFPREQVSLYNEFYASMEVYSRWLVLPWDDDAAGRFESFRKQGIRIGSMDLKIACITLAHGATLLTRNQADFAQVPGLKFENWVD